MLDVMRENLTHLKWVLWLVAISMIMYLGAFFSCQDDVDPSSDAWAAKVDGVTITTAQFLDAARRQDDTYRRMFGAQYEQLRKQLRLGSQVIQGLVDRKIMADEARSLGLAATPEDIFALIQSDPSFRDASGAFIGRERYAEVVNRNFPGGIPAFERQIADEIAVRKWIDMVTESAVASDADIEKAYRQRNEKAALDYVFAAAGAQDVATTVSESELQSWYDAHQDAYRRGEARRIRFLVIERQAQLAKVTVGDDEIVAAYQAAPSDFARPEQRRASHILFRVPQGATPDDKRSMRDLAESVLRRVKGGEDFAAVARAMSQDPGSAEKGGDLGFFGRGAMVGPFEDAVFGTPVGEFSPVVETPFGFHVIKVTDTRAAGTAPLEEVKDSIRRSLEVRKAQERVQSEAQRIRAALTAPSDLDAVAGKEGLRVEERVVTREDRGGDLGASPEFLDLVFSVGAGQLGGPVPLARGAAVVAVTEALPPSVLPLAEVRTRVQSDVLSERSRAAALAAARRAYAGGDLETAAKKLGINVQKSGDLVRGFALSGPGRSPELEAAVFSPSVTVGTTGVLGVPGGAVIYRVTRIDRFDPARFAAEKKTLQDELVEQRRGALLQALLETMRNKRSVEINTRVVEQANG